MNQRMLHPKNFSYEKSFFLLLILAIFQINYGKGQTKESFCVPEAKGMELLEDNKTLLVNTSTSFSFFSYPSKKIIKQIPHDSYSGSNYSMEFKNKEPYIIHQGISSIDKKDYLILMNSIFSDSFRGIKGNSYQFKFSYENAKKNYWYLFDYDGYLIKCDLDSSKVDSQNWVEGFSGNIAKIKKTATSKLIVLTKEGNLVLFDTEKNIITNTKKTSNIKFERDSYEDFNLAASPKNNFILVFDTSKISFWNSETLEKIKEYPFSPAIKDYPEKPILKFSNDGLFFGIAQQTKGTINIFETKTGLPKHTLKINENFVDFEINQGCKNILLLTKSGEILELPPNFTGNIARSKCWYHLFTNNNFAFTWDWENYINIINFDNELPIKKEVASTFWGYELFKAKNQNELYGLSPTSLKKINFKQSPISKSEIKFKVNHGSGDILHCFSELNNQVLFFNKKSRMIKLYDITSEKTIDSLKMINGSDLSKISNSSDHQSFFLFGSRTITKFQKNSLPEVLISDKTYRRIADNFGRNLILIYGDSYEIFDLDQKKVILDLPKSIFGEINDSNYLDITFSNNMKKAIYSKYFQTTKYLLDISNYKTKNKFEDPRILDIIFRSDSELKVIYNSKIETIKME